MRRLRSRIGMQAPQEWSATISSLQLPTPKTEPANQALGVGRRELGVSQSTVQKRST
jgi:hypothetical protein